MTERLKLTMASARRFDPSKSGRRWVYDTEVSGLVLLITEAGAKSWYVYKKIAGRPVRFNLGKFPTVTVDVARDQANRYLSNLADGHDPATAKRKQRGELTFGGLFKMFLEVHAEARKVAKSVKEDNGMWRRYLSHWDKRRLSSITHQEIHSLHGMIGKDHGKIAANRTLSLITKMFNVAKQNGEWTNKTNPTDGVKKFAEKSRDRFLQPDELPRFLKALDAEPNHLAADAFRLMLLTGARKMNVLSMAWNDLDLARASWRIPVTKQGEPQQVPLVPEAVAILTRLKDDPSHGAHYVFPSRFAGSVHGHMTDVTKVWDSVITKAGLPELRMHDLRRTMGIWQALQGTSLQVIGKSLGHRHASTTEIYARIMMDPVRESMTKAASAMMAAGKPVGAVAKGDEQSASQ